MIERYIYAVTRQLPASQREDIAEEIRGLIEDMLEERYGDGEHSGATVEEVLLELGNPTELARKYDGRKNYLIGPNYYEAYMIVLKIVLISAGAGIGVSFLIQTVIDPTKVLDNFIGMIVAMVTALPAAFGWTTLVFWIVERSASDGSIDLGKGEWTPSELPPVPDENRSIKRYRPMENIAFYLFVTILLAFNSDLLGAWLFEDGGFVGIIPILNTEAYGEFVFLLIFLTVLGIFKEGMKLFYGKWNYKLLLISVVTNIISLTAVILVLQGTDFFNPHFINGLVEAGRLTEGSTAYQTVTSIWENSILWIIVLYVIGMLVEVIDIWIRTAKK